MTKNRADIIKFRHIIKIMMFVLFFVAIYGFSPAAKAETILCGHTSCNLDTSQCIHKDSPDCLRHDSESGMCVEKEPTYQCVGKDRPLENGEYVVSISTDKDGKILSGEEETQALKKSSKAEYSTEEKERIVSNYYADKEQIKLSDNTQKILEKAAKNEAAAEKGLFNLPNTTYLQEALDKLSLYTTQEGYDKAMNKTLFRRNLRRQAQKAQNNLENLKKDGYINESEYQSIKIELDNMVRATENRLAEVYELTQETKKQEKLEKLAKKIETKVLQACPTSEQLRARYQAGCWSCLVVERLTSAFLHAANKGLIVTQKAGIGILLVGFLLWAAFWGLKNVSSFTEIQTGNILNDLFKMLFKVALAYIVISEGVSVISKFFITPIMSVGALMGQEFWDEDIKSYTEGWDTITDDDTAMLEEELKKETPQIETPLPDSSQTEEDTGLTEEEKEYDAAATKQNEAVFSQTQIPNLLIPGLAGGQITSLFGCRPSPCKGCSKTHSGVDAAVGSKAPCNPVVAAGPGTITYKVQRKNGSGPVTGYGYYAIIDHGSISGNTWKTYYAHMKMSSGGAAGTSRKVKQGEKIGCIGNTGVGTGAHLHFGVYFSGSVNNKKIEGFIDPLSLPAKKICTIDKSQCDGKGRKICNSSIVQQNPPQNQPIKNGGWPAAGQAVSLMTSASDTTSVGGGGVADFDSLVVDIPQDIKYTGPVNIMPKSVMNSLLGAIRAITDKLSDIQVLGNIMMCYSSMENGGAINIQTFGVSIAHIPNFFTWIEGAIVWCLAFMLILSISYYLLDISFKIGFAVLAFPLVMGLWPFKITESKLYMIISIIAKSAAIFAFLTLVSLFGMQILDEAIIGGGMDELFKKFDTLATGAIGYDEDQLRDEIDENMHLFSTAFLLTLFALLYFLKLVQKTSSDLVDKFFPDKAFGNASPMHSTATMMTSFAKNMVAAAPKFVGDVVANQTGRLIKGGLQRGAGTLAHPKQTARNIAAKFKGKKSGDGK